MKITNGHLLAWFKELRRTTPEWNLPIYFFTTKYDGRKKMFRGVDRAEWEREQKKSEKRYHDRWTWAEIPKPRVWQIREDLRIFSQIPYEYQGDGLDDYNRFQRPCSNGIGYVAICPGERGNNYYVDDPVTVAILKRKFNEHQKPQDNDKETGNRTQRNHTPFV